MNQTKIVLMILAIINMLSLGFFLLGAKRKIELAGADFLANFEEPETKIQNFTDPLVRLGAYPGHNYDDYALIKGHKYNQIVYGLWHNNKYCEKVDAFNLENPDNMFKKMNFFTDFAKGTLPQVSAMQKVGKVIDKIDRKKDDGQGKFEFSHEITNFYTEIGIHVYQHIGKHFVCATQMYNHIPGNGYLVRKTEVIQQTQLYAEKYKDQPQCFNKSEFFMPAYRLYIEKECHEFFDLINSQAYNVSLEKEPIQYLIKVGIGAHQSQGVFLLDNEKTQSMNKDYDFGEKCGKIQSSLIAQKYITNPLLLDMQNKFDFRIYMLIASTNPLVVYYHDGYLRVSVNSYDKNSTDRATHITNTAVAKKIFAKVDGTNNTYNGMNSKQLKDYHLWYLKDLQDYLLQTGKITDSNWLDNYLRPAFQKVMVHLIRMTGRYFYKGSNVYELHGLDLMLDDNLNLWFIEDNSSPLLHGVKPDLIARMLRDIYEIEYAFYRSRMTRVLEVVKKLQDKHLNNEEIDYEELKAEYQRALVNRLEPEYQISKENTFVKILDETLPGSQSLLGHLPEECF